MKCFFSYDFYFLKAKKFKIQYKMINETTAIESILVFQNTWIRYKWSCCWQSTIGITKILKKWQSY